MTLTNGRPEVVSKADGAGASFAADVVRGLAARPKRVSPKYLYDSAGAQLFDAICELPEYYLTRAELGILRAASHAIVAPWGESCRIVEPGAGSGTKTRLLLDALGPQRCKGYVPIDIAREHLAAVAADLRTEFPWLSVTPICADFTQELAVPRDDEETTVVYFPGSTIGNFDPPEALELLGRLGALAGPAGVVVLGVDLTRDPAALQAAYNDAQGVTAAFDRNLLTRMNRELDATFDVETFVHHAFYNPVFGRVEMHLVSTRRQAVSVAGRTFRFDEGESIVTEHSYKYDLPGITRLTRESGLGVWNTWLDDARRFAVLELRPLLTHR